MAAGICGGLSRYPGGGEGSPKRGTPVTMVIRVGYSSSNAVGSTFATSPAKTPGFSTAKIFSVAGPDFALRMKVFQKGLADFIARSFLSAAGFFAAGFKWFTECHVFSLLEGLF